MKIRSCFKRSVYKVKYDIEVESVYLHSLFCFVKIGNILYKFSERIEYGVAIQSEDSKVKKTH